MRNKVMCYVEKYNSNPILRGLIQLVPLGIGSAIDVSLTTKLANIKNKRIETFFDTLLKNNLNEDSKLLESEDFLHKYFLTVDLALKTRQEEKIKMFAKMLSNSFDKNDVDEYEDYLHILNELSYRELYILIELDNSHNENFKKFPQDNKLQLTERYWNEFYKKIINKFKISEGEINSLLVRLSRSGCYQLLAGEYISPRIGQGTVTEVWNKLKSKIQ